MVAVTAIAGAIAALTLLATYPFGQVYLRGNVKYTYTNSLKQNGVYAHRNFWKDMKAARKFVKSLNQMESHSDPAYVWLTRDMYLVIGVRWLGLELSSPRELAPNVTEEDIRAGMTQMEYDRVDDMWPWWRVAHRAFNGIII